MWREIGKETEKDALWWIYSMTCLVTTPIVRQIDHRQQLAYTSPTVQCCSTCAGQGRIVMNKSHYLYLAHVGGHQTRLAENGYYYIIT